MDQTDCVAATAEVIATKWTPQLLHALAGGPRRFSELERGVAGISPRTLTARLRGLEAAGIVERSAPADGGTAYGLTAMGEALLPIVAAMQAFGEQWRCAERMPAAAA